MTTACQDEFNQGQDCHPFDLKGYFGTNNIKTVCRYCLAVLGYSRKDEGSGGGEIGPNGYPKDADYDERQKNIETMLTKKLPEFDRNFLVSIGERDSLSAKQRAVYEKICRMHMGMPSKPAPAGPAPQRQATERRVSYGTNPQPTQFPPKQPQPQQPAPQGGDNLDDIPF